MGCSPSYNSHGNITSPTGNAEEKDTTFHDAYELGPKLGEGNYAQVRLATSIKSMKKGNSSITRAVKIIDLRDTADPLELSREQLKASKMEVTAWLAVGNHSNIIHLYDCFWGEQLCYLVMERCSCSLLSHLESTPHFNEATIAQVVLQMLRGLQHVHAVRVVHRDVKPDNFLCGGEHNKTIKLGDFGLAVAFPKSDVDGISGVFGTAPFMCPEMLAGARYDEKADVWSVAVITYVFLFGNWPMEPKERSVQAVKQAILAAHTPPELYDSQSKLSENAVAFCKALLNRDPKFRPSSSRALMMPYMLQAAGDKLTEPFPEQLPSFRAMLASAKKVGAFDWRDQNKFVRTDLLLHTLQMRHLNLPLPVTQPPVRSQHNQDDIRKSLKESACKDADFKPKNKFLRSPVPDSADSASTQSTTSETLDQADLSFSSKGSPRSQGSSNRATPQSTFHL